MVNDNYLQIHLREILYQIDCAKKSLNSLEENLFARHHHFLIHCANIHKILFPKPYKKDTPADKAIKKMRKEKLSDFFDNYKEFQFDKKFIDLRDHLEHFDERLDKIITDSRGNIVDQNISIGGTLPISGIPRKCFLRNLENGKYTILGDSFNINKLADLIIKIENHIKNRSR